MQGAGEPARVWQLVMAQPITVHRVTLTVRRKDAWGREYICQRFEPNHWWVGRTDGREWLGKDVSWREVGTLTRGQLPLF